MKQYGLSFFLSAFILLCSTFSFAHSKNTQLPEKPILIEHSLGGLAVQKQLGMWKAEAGICIDGVAPRGTLKKFAKIDFKKPHVPILFIAGEVDQIIPADLNKNNYMAYKDQNSKRDFQVFKGRGHYIISYKKWEEFANYVHEWIK